jgi:hypothetical protein
MIKVVCLDDNNRPNEIPFSKWIKKGQEYTIVQFDWINQMNRILGVKLAEIDLSSCFPYLYFRADRFAPTNEAGLKNYEKEVKIKEAELV